MVCLLLFSRVAGYQNRRKDMAKAPPSFQFYPADWLVGTAGLSHSSKATFLLLLCYEWTQAELPFEPEKLARMIGIPDEQFAEDWHEISCKFEIVDGVLRNSRLENIRKQVRDRSTRMAAAGRKGGLSKARAKLELEASLSAEDRRLKTEDRRQKRQERQEAASGFDAFWLAVDSKQGKAGCRKRYEQAVDSVGDAIAGDPHEYLLARLCEYQASAKGRSKYAWGILRWLRDGHYDDDPATWDASESNGIADPLGTFAAAKEYLTNGE